LAFFNIASKGGSDGIESQLKVTIPRNVRVSLQPFADYFKGFEKVEAVRQIFGEDTEKVLSQLKVEFAGIRGYMGVSETDGHLIIGAHYLNKGNAIDIYLDIIHELVHVKQFMEGKELFDSDYTYIERPTEVEAYRHAVKEAKRLGLTEKRICEYLKTEWMSDDDLKRLAQAVEINCSQKPEANKKSGA
jgi:hypothetical protein